jgi:hypothetical protein
MPAIRGLIRLVGLALVLVVLAGCGGSSSDKAGGTSRQKPRVLTMADAGAGSDELDGFVKEVARLSGETIRIEVKEVRQFR